MKGKPITIIQHNCAKTYEVLTSLLHYTNGTADIILVQEPWLASDGTPYSHPSFESILPDTTNNERPRTAAYISKSRLDILCSYRSDLLPHLDGDILPLQILAGNEKFTLWNIYNERRLRCRYNHSKRKNHTKFFAEPPPHWSTTKSQRFTPSL